MFARIENNKVKFYSSLPSGNFEGVIIFANANPSVHREHGFYPVEQPEYDKNTERLIPLNISDIDEVLGVWQQRKEAIPQAELDAMQQELIPQTAKNMKFRLALIKAGISINNINAAINGMEDGVQKEKIQTLWEFADFFERTDPTLIGMATQLEITDEQLDHLFILSNNETI